MARSTGKQRTVAVDVDAMPRTAPKKWPWPWYVAAVLGPIAVLVGGWLVISAMTVIGGFSSPGSTIGDALRLAAALLVLAAGGPVSIGAVAVTIAPLGVTLALIVFAVPLASFAARQAAGQHADPDDTGKLWVDGEAIALRVGSTFAVTYMSAIFLLSAFAGAMSLRGLLGGLVVGVVSGFWGAARGVSYDPTVRWPHWVRVIPRAMGAALLVTVAGGAALLAVALWVGRGQFTAMVQALDPGAAGAFLLIVVHLAYLPNFILAAVSWVLGAGISVGDGSLVTMATSDAGLLPSIPIFAIIPGAGFGSATNFWWLGVGVLAGILAGAIVTVARPRARFDETALVGGLAGVCAGLSIVVICALGEGSLGEARMVNLGARTAQLAIFAPAILGLSGLATGLILGLVRRPVSPPEVVGLPE